MPVRGQSQLAIDAPASKVFDYVADFTRHKEWGKHIIDIRAESAGPIGVGTKLAHQGRQMGTHSDKITVTEYAPGKRLAFESEGDAGRVRHWFDLRDEGGRTTLAKGMESIQLKGPAKLFAPFIQMTCAKAMAKDLRAIKGRIEGSGS